MKNKRVLVTCGPTWVAIDPVRIISNRSTGELGHRIAEELEEAGAKVTLLEGPIADPFKSKKTKVIKFNFFYELKNLLDLQLRHPIDCVIHAAAVSDFQPQKSFSSKLDSQSGKLALKLIATEKLINRIKKTARKTFLVGFKLSANNPKSRLIKEARKLFKEAHCDLVIANSATSKKYAGIIMNNQGNILGRARSRKQMAKSLIKLLKEKI